jgi:PAS domain S-box-containing protein
VNRLLLAVDHEVQRRLLRGWLAREYDVVEPGSERGSGERLLQTEIFDLAIVDTRAAERLARALQGAKRAARPLPLPVLLVASRRESPAVAKHLGNTADEILYAPPEKLELCARVEMMLSTRQLAVALHARADAGARSKDVRLHSALHAGRMGAWEWDLTTAQGTWSDNLAPMLGLPAGDLGPSIDVIHPDDRAGILEAVARSVRDGVLCELEFRTVWPDASEHWVASKCQPLRDAAGRVVRLIGIAMDVTDRRRQDEELHARIARQAALAELGQRALSVDDVAALMEVAVDLVARTLEVEFATLLQMLPGRRMLRVQAGVGWRPGVVGTTIPATHDPKRFALATGKPVVVDDLASDARFPRRCFLHEHGVVSMIAVAIPGPAGPFGELAAHTRRTRAFTADEMGFLQTAANIVAQAVQRRQAEERLGRLLENIPAALWTVDTELRITSCVGGPPALAGVSPESLVGTRVTEHFDAGGNLLPALHRALAGESVDLEYNWHEHAFHEHLEPLRAKSGEVVGVIGIALEVTEWARARAAVQAGEERFRALVENAFEAISLIDPTGKVLYVSPSNERVFGRGPGKALGTNWIAHVHPDFHAHAARTFGALAATPGATVREEGLIGRDDGEWRWMEVIATNLLDNPHVGAIVVNSRDITDRKQVEQALRESEERVYLAAESSNTGLWDWDLRRDRVYYSPQYKRQLGYDPDEMGESVQEWASRLHPEDRERAQARVDDYLREPVGAYENEFRLQHRDGSYRWIVSRGSVLFGADGRPDRMLGAHLDITERKAAEERLRVSEGRLRSALEIADMGTLDWDVRHGRVRGSVEMARIYGLPAGDFDGTYEELLARIHPEDRETVRSLVTDALAKPGNAAFDCRIVRPDGSVRWLASRAHTFCDERNVVTRMIGVIMDITERKAVEERLRVNERRLTLALDIAQLASWDWNVKTNEIAVSPQFERMLGVGPGVFRGTYEDFIARVHPDDRERLHGHLMRAVAERRNYDAECRLVQPDGSIRWIFGRGQFCDEDGTVRVVGINIDITERKLAEITLRASREQLRALSARLQAALEEERTRIAREIHDGLGQALTALKLELSWLSARLERSRSAATRHLHKRTEAMMQLVDATVHGVRRTATDLRPVVLDDLGLQAAVEWQAREFEARTGIRCEVAVATAVACPDRDVATALFRIVQEALTNVARHANASRVRVTLASDAHGLRLAVADDGRGITEAEHSGSRSLGLLGMRERARLFGGRIDIAGSPHGGTTVTATIPAAAAVPLADGAVAEAMPWPP